MADITADLDDDIIDQVDDNNNNEELTIENNGEESANHETTSDMDYYERLIANVGADTSNVDLAKITAPPPNANLNEMLSADNERFYTKNRAKFISYSANHYRGATNIVSGNSLDFNVANEKAFKAIYTHAKQQANVLEKKCARVEMPKFQQMNNATFQVIKDNIYS